MDVSLDKDWKNKLGFQINFKSDSEEDPDVAAVVMRRPPPSRRSTEYLLDDVGDGAEADLLSSTPPRALIRKKEKARRWCVFGRENIDEARFQKMMRDRRNTTVYVSSNDAPIIPERLKKRWSLKRSTDRDWKIEMGQRGEAKADSLPLTETPAVPTLVESCSRFMSLTSRLKCRASHAERAAEREAPQEQLPESRVNFHRTFSMLINMGNVDKGCRRTISREEQVWQNELKDLIWLELQAKIAGRTLAQQDLFLCSQRNIIPTLIKNIIDYKFVNPNPCKGRSKRLCATNGSREDLTNEDPDDETEEDKLGCLSFDCRLCSSAIGAAMSAVRALLDAFHRAGALYPSSCAMTADHNLLATSLFQNRIKALCLWYNMAMHMRLKILSVRRLLATVGAKGRRAVCEDYPCLEPGVDGERRDRDTNQCTQRQVRFICDNPTSSTNSDESCPTENQSEVEKEPTDQSECDAEQSGVAQSANGENKDETDCVIRTDENGHTTPEIIISDAKYSTNDTSTSSESGYMSERERWFNTSSSESVFNVGSLADLTRLRLLEKCDVSPYREYHYEILKIQGVRRSMMFIHKLRTKLLNKVYLTFLQPESTLDGSSREEDPTDASDEKNDKTQRAREGEDEHELRRFGCWSEETLSMGLPSYRNHFLLLSSICMEAVHDYLTLRLEGRPEHPSCLTIKQLIHELKEGLDIATTMRQAFVGNIEVALRGCRAGHAARQDLLLIIKTFDASVEDVFKQYLSYLTAMSEVEHMPRSSLEAEWSFVARVAERGSWVKDLAPVAFTDIACNQLNRVMKQFEAKIAAIDQVNKPEPDRYVFYTLCREAQSVFASEREAALQAAAFARALASRHARAGLGARRARRRIYVRYSFIIDRARRRCRPPPSRARSPRATRAPASAPGGPGDGSTYVTRRRLRARARLAPRARRPRRPAGQATDLRTLLVHYRSSEAALQAAAFARALASRHARAGLGARSSEAALQAAAFARALASRHARAGLGARRARRRIYIERGGAAGRRLRARARLAPRARRPRRPAGQATDLRTLLVHYRSSEAALQAAAFARALASRHARAGLGARRARRRIYESLFQLRECIVRHTMEILEHASKSPPEEYLHEVTDGVVARVRDLLLQIYRLGFELHRECYKFVHGNKPPPRRQRPSSLQPPRTTLVRPRRPETMLVHESVNPMIHKELHRFVNERFGPTCRRPRAPRWLLRSESVTEDEPEGTFAEIDYPEIKVSTYKELHRFVNERFGPTCRRPRASRWLLRSESVTEDEPDGTFAEIDYPEIKTQVSIEELLGSPPPPPQPRPEQEPDTDEEAWSAAVARAIVCFARCWMRFVLERCERGRGRRPRWASQGLEFLMLACDPYNTRHLSDEEFEELKHLMDGCISHVIGSRGTTRGADAEPAPRPRHRLHSPLPSQTGASKESPTPSTPPGEPEAAPNFNVPEPQARTRSVMEAIKKLDMSRDAALRSMKAVGRVAEPAVTPDYEPRVRQVTFKWQRGLKIGAGTFGKVYTVVNTETGQLLAMKEVSIAAGDRRAMQRAANELRVLEGAQHPHLVRYYGIEVHREEMLIFMELCVEGSLETLIATSGALPEQTVRRYTSQLLSAVSELHARNIAHRDIKSGNIFLMNEGHCLKLGDFGCAVKIRATATAAGELQGYVGTQAYMAPEVFMKSDGHGRATDIWSLGCVVTEMASGKRPFSEYDSNYQIMFLVGMGGRPHIPETLSEEGQQFCLLCLTHDPDKRPKAEALKLHHFLMVKNDECFECQPGKFL
ncbi:mitogen-activated protein kinase kinase kinase 4 [Cydia pomonella]|uniref:mitogen-activated protein kinase kinase kinase 4 n=1 Tax=Cydia pomonella TaxID=82600 RepID=UPI002ADD743D|nr:mitogen-activated protein kinase kinase kinase 4 [Cydia pomonella]